MKLEILGLDPGNSAIKVARLNSDQDQIEVTTLPSLAGVGKENTGLVGPVEYRRATATRRHPYHVEWNGWTLVTGLGVDNVTDTIQRMDPDRVQDTPAMRALIYTALGNALGPGRHDLALVVGLPVNTLQSPQAQEIVADLRGWLIGSHLFTLDNEAFELRVHSILPNAQPTGALADWALDNSGAFRRSKKDRDARNGVLDLGGGTLDLYAIRDARVVSALTHGDFVGTRVAGLKLIELLQGHHNRPVGLHEADRLLADFVTTGQAELEMPGRWQNVGDLCRLALVHGRDQILQFINDHWKSKEVFLTLCLSGGGVLWYPDIFDDLAGVWNPQDDGEVFDPVGTNARGLCKIGQRPNIFRRLKERRQV